jgi:hypothetical protein
MAARKIRLEKKIKAELNAVKSEVLSIRPYSLGLNRVVRNFLSHLSRSGKKRLSANSMLAASSRNECGPRLGACRDVNYFPAPLPFLRRSRTTTSMRAIS